MFALKVYFFLLCVTYVYLQDSNPVVQVKDGKLEGIWLNTGDNRKYAAFRGIPYADPPVGEYRFEDPQPVTPWSGVLNATKFGAACIQIEELGGTLDTLGAENCLFLNVYTPNLKEAARLPVAVFFHGGDFMGGSADIYDPVRLMEYDMIIITLNSRQGPLGFFSTGDDVVAGNAGLKDQAFALHWIKRNIKKFGGDPDSVTLMGHSTGAACMLYHYLSPRSQGTFHRGIAFSGSLLAPWALDDYPVEKGRTLAGLVGCPYTTNRDMVRCLKSKPAAEIIKAQLQTREELGVYKIFQPTIESKKVRNPFLAEHPYFAAVSGKMSRVPLMMTTTKDEGLIPTAAFVPAPQLLDRLEERWLELASYMLDYNRTLARSRSAEVGQKIKDFYLNGDAVTIDKFWPLVRMFTDRIYHAYIGQLALIHASRSGIPVYMYEYSFTGAYSFSNFYSGNSVMYGAAHSDDIMHLLILLGVDSNSTGDVAMNKVMGDMLYSYATTSVPKLPGNAKWEPIAPGCKEVQYVEISSPTEFEMRSSRDFGNRTFWESLKFNENQNYKSDFNSDC